MVNVLQPISLTLLVIGSQHRIILRKNIKYIYFWVNTFFPSKLWTDLEVYFYFLYSVFIFFSKCFPRIFLWYEVKWSKNPPKYKISGKAYEKRSKNCCIRPSTSRNERVFQTHKLFIFWNGTPALPTQFLFDKIDVWFWEIFRDRQKIKKLSRKIWRCNRPVFWYY